MKTIAIIPARGGSKRLPGKNILKLDGVPLIAHSILYAKANAMIDAVFVSTDDAEISRVATEFGATVITRPSILSGDLEPTVTALKHVLQNLEHSVENVVLLQATNPLRPKNMLAEAFDIFNSSQLDSLFTVSRNHQKLGKIKNNRFTPFNYIPGERSQDLAPLYFENGLLYIAKTQLIVNDVIMSENAHPMEIDHIFGQVDIDTEEDFEWANFLIQKYKK